MGMSIDPNNIPYRKIFARIDDLRAMLLKRGFMIGLTIDGVRWEVWRKDRNWYVGRIKP
jgi:hypothetical protein